VDVSRRAFIAAVAAAAAGCRKAESGPVAAPARAKYPDEYQRDGGLIILPSKGTLYIATDFHGRRRDFEAWLSRTGVVEKIKAGEDVYGLLTGDLVDCKPEDTQAEPDGDSLIVQRVMGIQRELGEKSNRFILLMGNHEAEVQRIYGILKEKAGMTPRNQKAIVKALFSGEQGTYFDQFNFLERINDQQYAFLKDLPVAVLCKNGVVITHGGPTIEGGLDAIVKKEEKPLEMLFWGRPTEYYKLEQVDAFLQMMEDSTLLVTGHTPLPSLPAPSVIRDGVGMHGEHQVIVATSYGASSSAQKCYLVLDLARRYLSVNDLRVGKEILRLSAGPTTAPAGAERELTRWFAFA